MQFTLTMLDTLLDLHAKLATVVRYYDRMLEDRLSHTYSQHSLGPSRAQMAPPSSNMYPQIPSEPPPSAQGGAESYYNMTSAPPVDSFQPPPVYNQYPSQPQSPYMQRDRTQSNGSANYGFPTNQRRTSQSAQVPQRTSSIASYDRSPTQNGQAPYYTSSQPQPYQQYPPSQGQPPPQPTTNDRSTSYYTNQNNPEVSPLQQYSEQAPIQQGYQQGYQPAKAPQPTQNPPQQPYWQQPRTGPPQQAQGYADPPSNYTQESFPTAPQHQPQKKAVEEALIEL